ncbi:flagellar basal body-associated protein FliL [Bacillus sp. AFS073361]|uniref:flagellar basal body-associated FliL family protein n=1 Tax=Bacillus sp. AFS073361 TaxID=2033511 RepID=UPI000BF3FE6B|nr:flagellar basal body-associated FliL family protein [Bacillus sp. AFS073361]PFP30814.1 flagellar basal body-associated protein FliL [Bacillus sp. AFS073361]
MKLKPIILIVVAAVLLLGGVWFFLHLSTAKDETKEDTNKLSADDILATMVETEPMTTNLNSGGFIQFRFKIQTSSEDAKEELTKRDFQVRNAAIQFMSSMTEEQVKSPDGMSKFEKDMKTELNKQMENGSIIRIFTTNKMVQ